MKSPLEKIINLIREQEAPTNHTGPAVAEFSPVMGKAKKRKKRIGVWSRSLRKNSESK